MCLPNLLLVGYVFANYLAIHQGFTVVALNDDYPLYRISLPRTTGARLRASAECRKP